MSKKQRWGASPEAWKHFADVLGRQTDLLPVVSNPNRMISEYSTLSGLGKVPSQINFRGEATGFRKWTDHTASKRDISAWSAEPDHGLCVQTGKGWIAIDIDVPDPMLSAQIKEVWTDAFGDQPCAERYREGTGKTLLLIEYPWGDLFKRVTPVGDGMAVELLGVGQQFIAEGTYINARSGRPDGRYLWRVGSKHGWPGPDEIPCLDPEEFEAAWEMMELLYATGDTRVARSRRGPLEGLSAEDLPDPKDDAVAAWIGENWNVYDHDNDGRLFIECPFADEHTTDSGPTATAYFPAGTGGYQRGHFQCMHAHCQGYEDNDFLERIGYDAAQFPDLGRAPGWGERQSVVEDGDSGTGGRAIVRAGEGRGPGRSLDVVGQDAGGGIGSGSGAAGSGALADKAKGTVLASEHRLTITGILDNRRGFIMKPQGEKMVPVPCMTNLLMMIGPHKNITHMRLAFDKFTDRVVWAPADQQEPAWRPFGDHDYAKLLLALDAQEMPTPADSMLRKAVGAVAQEFAIDTAIEWLSRLRWDGVERVETFITDTMPGVEDRPYIRALSRYLWTALAGRVLEPGVKADMIPILVGGEGLFKSSWVQALSPSEEARTEVSLKHRDDDVSRRLRGKLVVELAELQGLASRDGEEIRAFLSRQKEEWTPKYMEMATTFLRRCMFIGTTNDTAFIQERMGKRRLLPFLVEGYIDIERVHRDRDQLWAEAAVMFKRSGVDWSVEKLAANEREGFANVDDWTAPVVRWLATPDAVTGIAPMDRPQGFTTGEVLVGAIGLAVERIDRVKQIRMGEVLSALGCTKHRTRDGATRGWRSRVPPELRERLAASASSDEGSAF